MQIDVNGTRLWFDVDGMGLVPDGPSMRERPTIVLVHDGPGGYDHTSFKPHLSPLTKVAQLVYLDLRGLGRSARHAPDEWSLEACADDLAAFCEALGIERPIILGHSMGGFVALLHALRHPGLTGGLVLLSTAARWDPERLVDGFRSAADDRVAEVARRAFAGEPVSDAEADQVAAALGPNVLEPEERARQIGNPEIQSHGMDEVRLFDVVGELHAIACPTLVIVGDRDPVTPVDGANEIMAGLPMGIGRRVVIHGAGHFAWLDAPERVLKAIEDFVAEIEPELRV